MWLQIPRPAAKPLRIRYEADRWTLCCYMLLLLLHIPLLRACYVDFFSFLYFSWSVLAAKVEPGSSLWPLVLKCRLRWVLISKRNPIAVGGKVVPCWAHVQQKAGCHIRYSMHLHANDQRRQPARNARSFLLNPILLQLVGRFQPES